LGYCRRLLLKGDRVLAVPPWRAGLEVSVLPQAYRDLVEAAEDAGRPLRAAQIAAAAGLSTDACRHLIGDRLDITGARWGLQGAEAVLTLRAVISNGDFDELGIPPHPRAPAALPRHSTRPVHTRRLTPHSKRAAPNGLSGRGGGPMSSPA
jgi:hypothetical protein